jgi:hypothetical protein
MKHKILSVLLGLTLVGATPTISFASQNPTSDATSATRQDPPRGGHGRHNRRRQHRQRHHQKRQHRQQNQPPARPSSGTR